MSIWRGGSDLAKIAWGFRGWRFGDRGDIILCIEVSNAVSVSHFSRQVLARVQWRILSKREGGEGTYHMIAHRDKQIKEQLPPALHLHLHRPAPLERAPTPDDQSQIVCPQLRITVRRIGIRIPRTGQDRRALDATLQPLLPQRQPLQLLQPILLRGAINKRILQQLLARGITKDCTLDRPSGTSVIVIGLQLPAVAALVVQEARVVVAFVEVFQHRGEDLGRFVGEGDAFGDGLEELGADYGGEEGGEGEDVFVGGEEAGGGADAEGYDWGGHCTVGWQVELVFFAGGLGWKSDEGGERRGMFDILTCL